MNSSLLQRNNRNRPCNHYCNCLTDRSCKRSLKSVADPGFRRRDADGAHHEVGAPTCFLNIFPQKLHEIGKIGPREGYASLSPLKSVNENRQYGSGSRRSTTGAWYNNL